MTLRRSFLRLAGFSVIAGAAYGGTALLRRVSEPGLVFEPVVGMPGFRRIAGGPVSSGVTAFVGIEGGSDQQADGLFFRDGTICAALYGPAPDPQRVQIAYFTDYRCLYCRRVSPMLAKMAAAGKVQVTWHDLPLMDQISDITARAAVAAQAQGAYDSFHQRLMGTPIVPTPAFLRQMADEAGIDPAQLLRDMKSPQTRQQLQRTAALARQFGFIGTPALVVGHTAVLGSVDRRLVERLIDAERETGQHHPC